MDKVSTTWHYVDTYVISIIGATIALGIDVLHGRIMEVMVAMDPALGKELMISHGELFVFGINAPDFLKLTILFITLLVVTIRGITDSIKAVDAAIPVIRRWWRRLKSGKK